MKIGASRRCNHDIIIFFAQKEGNCGNVYQEVYIYTYISSSCKQSSDRPVWMSSIPW